MISPYPADDIPLPMAPHQVLLNARAVGWVLTNPGCDDMETLLDVCSVGFLNLGGATEISGCIQFRAFHVLDARNGQGSDGRYARDSTTNIDGLHGGSHSKSPKWVVSRRITTLSRPETSGSFGMTSQWGRYISDRYYDGTCLIWMIRDDDDDDDDGAQYININHHL